MGDRWNLLAFAAVMAALGVLYAFGLRIPVPAAGWRRGLARAAVVAGAATMTLLANVALVRHDLHVDVTPARAFTPSAETLRVVQGLTSEVGVTYFYQKQNPAGLAAKTMVELLGRASARLRVRTVDPDQHPGLAGQLGVRTYNVAVIETEGRRLQVVTTDDRDIALGILRVTRRTSKTLCFTAGHGQHDMDNFDYHTPFEGAPAPGPGGDGAALGGERQGIGRLRRALESVGFLTRKVTLATLGHVPEACAAVIEAGPRTLYTPLESDALREYLGGGGAALLLYDTGFPVEPRLGALLESAGIRLGEGVVVDPLDHYFTNDEMVAVTRYGDHAITRRLALSFYPGARPLELVPADGVRVTSLLSSSPESYVKPLRAAPRPVEARGGARVLGAAVEGTLPGSSPGGPSRLVVIGDADFAGNSFFPYMSNSEVLMAAVAWLVREERAPVVKPPVEVSPSVTLTAGQGRTLFALTVIALPGVVVGVGTLVWWRRRR